MGLGLPEAANLMTEITNLAAFNSLVFGELPTCTQADAQVGDIWVCGGEHGWGGTGGDGGGRAFTRQLVIFGELAPSLRSGSHACAVLPPSPPLYRKALFLLFHHHDSCAAPLPPREHAPSPPPPLPSPALPFPEPASCFWAIRCNHGSR